MSFGVAFVYASMYECIKYDFDLFLKTYSVGVAIGGLFISIVLSINTFLYRKKVMDKLFSVGSLGDSAEK